MSNRHQELTSPEQTAIGKDFSNPLIVDSLLKTIWSSMHHVFTIKHWLVQSKRLLIIDFLNQSHICYALTKKPEVCVSFIKQFWRSAEASTDDNVEVKINATIDGHSLSITEGSLRRHLKLADQDGGAFSPQWRFLIHCILHCISPKKTAWEQFSSNIATAVICLAINRKFKFSRMIFEHMMSNISSPYKFFMYLRPTKGYSGQEVALFPTMIDVTAPSTSPSRITSSPSHSPEHSPSPTPSPSPEPTPAHTTADIGKARRQARVVLSDDEDLEDDSSKQGRKLSDAEVQEKASTDTELFIQEVTPTEVIQDQEGSEKASDEVSTAGAKKGTASEEVPIVSTAEVNLSTAGGTVTYTRRSAEKRSRQDKGKAIMIESEPKKKSKKELEQERLSYVEAIRLEEQMNEEQRAQIARDEEIARQWDEEERKRAMAEAKSTKKIDWNDPSVIRYHSLKMKPKTVAQARRNMIKYLKNQGNYKISDFKGMSYNDIRPIFEKVWDFNQNIEPMDAEHGSEKQKSPEKEKSPEKSPEKLLKKNVDT
ncbi:hypothetical protein Tco_0730328 [Tanacetum coccineum]|uniref:Uncharacterized protein n=1 Tax=Tanacetum coccineum TaxID=301880 RepID=A0ABQ4YSB7_9ASTR